MKTRLIIRYHENQLRTQLGLTYPNALVLLILDEKETFFVDDISKKLWLDTGTLTPLLKKLQTKGYIERKRNLQDERRVSVSLTAQGRACIDKIKTIFDQTAQKMNLPTDVKQHLFKALMSINLNEKD